MQPFTTVGPSLLKLCLDSSDVQNTIQQRLYVYLYVVHRATYVHKNSCTLSGECCTESNLIVIKLMACEKICSDQEHSQGFDAWSD